MKKILLSVFVALISLSVSAQHFGVKAGVNIAGFYGNDAEETKNITGFNVGALYEVPISGGFYFQPELLLSMKGASASESGVEMKIKPYYIDVPLKLMYKFRFDAGNLTLAAGPYVGLGVFGKMSGESQGVTASADLFTKVGDATEPLMKRFDAGIASTVAFELPKGLFFSMDSNMGLVKVVNDGDLKNSVVSFGVGYKF